MKAYYDIEETEFGFTLKSAVDTYVMNKSKIYKNDYQFYLKKVEPTLDFISGLFKQKKNLYVGKTKDNKRVQVRLMQNTALIVIE